MAYDSGSGNQAKPRGGLFPFSPTLPRLPGMWRWPHHGVTSELQDTKVEVCSHPKATPTNCSEHNFCQTLSVNVDTHPEFKGVNSPSLLMDIPMKLKKVLPAVCLDVAFLFHPLTIIPSLILPITHSFFVCKVILILVCILSICLFHIIYFISCFGLPVHVNATNLRTLVLVLTASPWWRVAGRKVNKWSS